mmetsp:Transcript_31257/g.73354  ORF Transcript_31257/g.73354 Transcript_31257/m.73354 type:complete len:220 (-) Transcript_31257:100-759(-)
MLSGQESPLDSTEEDLRLKPQDEWQPDSEVASCAGCSQPFTWVFRRRHHCRVCGKIFCGNCCSWTTRSDGSSLRACDECLEQKASQLCRTASAQKTWVKSVFDKIWDGGVVMEDLSVSTWETIAPVAATAMMQAGDRLAPSVTAYMANIVRVDSLLHQKEAALVRLREQEVTFARANLDLERVMDQGVDAETRRVMDEEEERALRAQEHWNIWSVRRER